MNKRTEAHILAVIKSLRAEMARVEERRRPHEKALDALDVQWDAISIRLRAARVLLGDAPPQSEPVPFNPTLLIPDVSDGDIAFYRPVDAPDQEPAPQSAPAPIPEGEKGAVETPHYRPIGATEESEESWRETLAHAEREEKASAPVVAPALAFLAQGQPTVSSCAHPRTYTRKNGVRRCVVCGEAVER